MMDGVSIEFTSNSDAWSEDNSSYMLSSDSDDGNEENNSLPEYIPPMFPLHDIVLSAAYKLQVELNTLFDRNKASLGNYIIHRISGIQSDDNALTTSTVHGTN